MSAPTPRRARSTRLESALYPGEGVEVCADDTDGRVTIRVWRGGALGSGMAATLSGAERVALLRALAFPGGDELADLAPQPDVRTAPRYRQGGW